MRDLIWHGISVTTAEVCRIDASDERVEVRSVIDGAFGTVAYELRADVDWTFRSLHLIPGDRELDIVRLDGRWFVNGMLRLDLEAAREVDISASPLTNTLPIRRLALRQRETADVDTAYISVPDLAVALDPQRYTRLARSQYLYESRDTPFSATITVDDDGLVVDYPGLFERRET